MVSFWPFKGDDKSAASFEKTLSRLSSKINKASSQNDLFRQHQRRYKALWTLYTIFAYILVAAILTLVTGWEKWGSLEYGALAGGPAVIWSVRTLLDAYYNHRISNSQNHLNDLVKQREVTIEQLKAATKYNSTQELLEKYGGTPKKPQPSSQPQGDKRKPGGGMPQPNVPQPGRTGFMPPPTANIPGRQPPPLAPPPGPKVLAPGNALAQPSADPRTPQSRPTSPGEEFAPNAFTMPSKPSIQPTPQYATEGPKWYDRILDLVLGEDEAQAKNRFALICQNCRLVNGQAPPGVRTLEDVGEWRCSNCHAMNGVESEEKRILKQISRNDDQPSSPASPSSPNTRVLDEEYEHVDADEDEEEEEQDKSVTIEPDAPPASST